MSRHQTFIALRPLAIHENELKLIQADEAQAGSKSDPKMRMPDSLTGPIDSNSFGHRRKICQTGGNRLSKRGDAANFILVAPADYAGFKHGGLRHLYGSPDGAGPKYIS